MKRTLPQGDRFIPIGDWLPDQPDYNNPGSPTIENVIPRTKTSYSPVPAFQRVATTPLAGPPLGAFSSPDSNGNPALYAGTASKLYRATAATIPNFVDASGAAYAVPSGGHWSFTTDAGNYVYASNGSDAIQRAQIATATAFAAHPDANAPKASILAWVQPGFLLCGDINDVTVGVLPQGIRWSALGNAASFPLVGSQAAISAESDYQNVQGPHGRIKAIAPDLATCNAGLFFEKAIFRMVYTGDENIFDIQPVEKLLGTPAGRSVIQSGQVAYYLSWDGWRSFDGVFSRPIGAGRVNTAFFEDCDPNYFANVVGVVDPLSGICFWAYPGAGNNLGAPNRILCYNPVVDRFSLITALSGTSPFIGSGFSISLDQIDSLGYTLDSLPFSLDAPFLSSSQILLSAFDQNNYYGTFTGPNMAVTVDTTEFNLVMGRRSKITAVRPITQGDSMSAQIASRQTLKGPINFLPSAPVAPNASGIVPIVSDGMFQRMRLTAPAGNSLTHIQGAQVVGVKPTGKR